MFLVSKKKKKRFNGERVFDSPRDRGEERTSSDSGDSVLCLSLSVLQLSHATNGTNDNAHGERLWEGVG